MKTPLSPRHVIGSPVQVSLMKPPKGWNRPAYTGRIERLLQTDGDDQYSYYSIRLDSEINITSSGSRQLLNQKQRPGKVAVVHLIVKLLRSVCLEGAFSGVVFSEEAGPIICLPRDEGVLERERIHAGTDIIELSSGFVEITEPIGFDPATAVGCRVEIKTLLDWDVDFPQGTIVRLLATEPPTSQVPQVLYVIDLDSPVNLDLGKPTALFKHKPRGTETRRRIIVAFRRPMALREELRGSVLSEETAPMLYCLRWERAPSEDKAEIRIKDLHALGPGRIEVIGE